MKTTKGMTLVVLAVSALAISTLITACSGTGADFAYTGRMDVDTITLSAQAAGSIDSLPVNEGDSVRQGQVLGQINTDRLQAQKRQQEAQVAELDVKRSAAEAQLQQADAQLAAGSAQVDQVKTQLSFSEDTLAKTEKVLASGGATQQRRDELANQVAVSQSSLTAQESNYRALESNYKVLESNLKLISAQQDELRAAMDLTDIAIRDAQLVSPVDGIVLNKFHFEGELATVGTPLLELADLSHMTVEIYVPLAALGTIKIGGHASVSVEGIKQSFVGEVSWIASEAEFTPKTILTQETQTTLVYGVKIRVPNPDGILKIGMPVEVRL